MQEKILSRGHPKLRQLKSAVAALRAEIEELPEARTESEAQINPVFEKIKVDKVRATARNLALKSRLDYLDNKYELAQKRLRELNELVIESGHLQRELQVAHQEMDIYMRKKTESAVVNDLNDEFVSDVVVAQNANLVVKHVSPRGSILIPLGAILASLCAHRYCIIF